MANGDTKIKKGTKMEWEALSRQLTDIIYLLGGLLFIPTVGIALSVAYGLRAGLISGTEKWLELLKAWREYDQ